MPGVHPGQIGNDRYANDTAEIAAGIHEAADRHGIASTDRHGATPVRTLRQLHRVPIADVMRSDREIGIRACDGVTSRQRPAAGIATSGTSRYPQR